MIKNEINLGLNDKDLKIQLVETDAALEYVYNLAGKMFGGCTVTAGRGIYTHDDGVQVKENSFIITVYTESEKENAGLIEYRENLKKHFNQEAVYINQFYINNSL